MRFMGTPGGIAEVIPQQKVEVHATQSIYTFADEQVRLKIEAVVAHLERLQEQ